MAPGRPDLPCRDGCRRARAGRCSGTLCHSAIRQPNPSPRARKGQDCWSRPVAAVGVAPQCPHGRAARAAGAGHGAGTGVHGGPSTSEGRCRLGCGPCRPAAGCRQVNRFRLTRPLETTCRGACNGHGPARPQRHDVMRNPWLAPPAETRPRRCHGTLFSRCCAGTAGARQGC